LSNQFRDPTVETNLHCADVAVLGNTTQPACQSAYQACIAAGAEPDAGAPSISNSKCGSFTSVLAGCGATVGQVEQCYSDFFATIHRFDANMVCSELEDGGQNTVPNAGEPASCAVFSQQPSCAALDPGSPLPSETTVTASPDAG
jgi:hypothetical protein